MIFMQDRSRRQDYCIEKCNLTTLSIERAVMTKQIFVIPIYNTTLLILQYLLTQIGNLFPSHKSTVITGLQGLYGSSQVVFFILKVSESLRKGRGTSEVFRVYRKKWTAHHRVRGSSPSAALMFLGNTSVSICHSPPRMGTWQDVIL